MLRLISAKMLRDKNSFLDSKFLLLVRRLERNLVTFFIRREVCGWIINASNGYCTGIEQRQLRTDNCWSKGLNIAAAFWQSFQKKEAAVAGVSCPSTHGSLKNTGMESKRTRRKKIVCLLFLKISLWQLIVTLYKLYFVAVTWTWTCPE